MDLQHSESEAPWYTSLWFFLVVIALAALLIAWSVSGRAPSRVEEEAQAPPPAQVGPGQDQSGPRASPSDQPGGGNRNADQGMPL